MKQDECFFMKYEVGQSVFLRTESCLLSLWRAVSCVRGRGGWGGGGGERELFIERQ